MFSIELKCDGLYRWRDTSLVVRAATKPRLCLDPEDKFYKEYVFDGIVLDNDTCFLEKGSTVLFTACEGWEEFNG